MRSSFTAAKKVEKTIDATDVDVMVTPSTETQVPRSPSLFKPVVVVTDERAKLPKQAATEDERRASVAVQAAFTTMFQYGTFERFPKLKFIVLESSAGWISSWLERMDAKFESIGRFSRKMKKRPSGLFKKHCWNFKPQLIRGV